MTALGTPRTGTATGTWLTLADGPEDAPLVLVLPFAGGGRSFFPQWEQHFRPWARLCYVNLPGRDLRLREDAVADLGRLLPPLVAACAPVLQRLPYAILGHSMGALIGYELAAEARELGLPPARHLLFSGLCSPDTPLPGKPLADASDVELLTEMMKIMGVSHSDAALTEQIVSATLPTARADFTLCERYRWRPRPALDIDLTVMWSVDDPLTTPSGVAAWERHTTGRFRALQFQGSHFFLRGLGPVVAEELGPLLRDTAGGGEDSS